MLVIADYIIRKQPLRQYLHLFLEHGVVSGDDVDVEVPDPVGDQHGEGEGEEDDQGGGLQRPAALQQRQHGHQQHHPQADVQVPAPCKSIITIKSVLFLLDATGDSPNFF